MMVKIKKRDNSVVDFNSDKIVNAIRKAGDYFGFRCPLDGEYKVGNNWAETH